MLELMRTRRRYMSRSTEATIVAAGCERADANARVLHVGEVAHARTRVESLREIATACRRRRCVKRLLYTREEEGCGGEGRDESLKKSEKENRSGWADREETG
jgi:hypothetical protein